MTAPLHVCRFNNDISNEVLEKSLRNREHQIDWKSLKLFVYNDSTKPTALQGSSTTGRWLVRISVAAEPGNHRPERPMAVFYRIKRNQVKHLEEAYYLTDEEAIRFQSFFEIKH